MTNTIPDADALIKALEACKCPVNLNLKRSAGYTIHDNSIIDSCIDIVRKHAQPQAQGDDHRARVAQGLCSPKNPCNSCIALMPIPKPQGDCRAEFECRIANYLMHNLSLNEHVAMRHAQNIVSGIKADSSIWKASRGEGI